MTHGMLVRAHVAHDSGMTFCDHKIFPLQKVNWRESPVALACILLTYHVYRACLWSGDFNLSQKQSCVALPLQRETKKCAGVVKAEIIVLFKIVVEIITFKFKAPIHSFRFYRYKQISFHLDYVRKKSIKLILTVDSFWVCKLMSKLRVLPSWTHMLHLAKKWLKSAFFSLVA